MHVKASEEFNEGETRYVSVTQTQCQREFRKEYNTFTRTNGSLTSDLVTAFWPDLSIRFLTCSKKLECSFSTTYSLIYIMPPKHVNCNLHMKCNSVSQSKNKRLEILPLCPDVQESSLGHWGQCQVHPSILSVPQTNIEQFKLLTQTTILLLCSL